MIMIWTKKSCNNVRVAIVITKIWFGTEVEIQLLLTRFPFSNSSLMDNCLKWAIFKDLWRQWVDMNLIEIANDKNKQTLLWFEKHPIEEVILEVRLGNSSVLLLALLLFWLWTGAARSLPLSIILCRRWNRGGRIITFVGLCAVTPICELCLVNKSLTQIN